MTDWVRLWHDMPTDPKWRVVARKSGQPLPCVLAVFTLMLTNASGNSADRGCLLAWDHEDAGAALDMDADDVRSIYDAMQGKVLDGDRLTGWERRQPKREDNTAAERKAAWKARKNASERTGTQENAPETDAETDADAEKEEKGDAADAADKFAFFGKTIRLTEIDLHRWRKTYHAILGLEAELMTLDGWWEDQPADKKKRWFHATQGMLNRKHQELLAARPKQPTVPL